MAKQEEISQVVTSADRDKALKLLRYVTGWRVYPSQAESLTRKIRAYELLEHLQTDESWLGPAKTFLYKTASAWPELCAGWVAL